MYAALAFIEAIPPQLLADDSGCRQLEGEEITAASNLFKWANEAALPSLEFAAYFDDNVEMTSGAYQKGQKVTTSANANLQRSKRPSMRVS